MVQSKLEGTQLRVDPAIGVIDLQRVLKKHVDNAPDKYIWNILKHPTGAPFSWKTSVCLPWIAQASDLLVDFLKIAPNGLLPAAKLRLSLGRLLTDGTEKTEKVNRTNYHTDGWVDQVDSRIRILLAQVRSLKKHDEYVKAMRRATELKRKGSMWYCLMCCTTRSQENKDDTVGASSSGKAGEATGLEIVPYKPREMQSDNIFGRILAKQESSPWPLKKGRLVMGPGSPIRVWRGARSSCSPKAVTAAGAAEDPMVLGRPLMVGDLGSSSSEENVSSKAAASSSSRPVGQVAPHGAQGAQGQVHEEACGGRCCGQHEAGCGEAQSRGQAERLRVQVLFQEETKQLCISQGDDIEDQNGPFPADCQKEGQSCHGGGRIQDRCRYHH